MIDSIISQDLNKIQNLIRKDVFASKSVLVTGGAGFLGSWICDILVSCDAEVCCLDDLSTGKSKNIDHLIGKPRFKFVNGNVCFFRSDEKYDFVFHLASHVSPEEYQQNPIETLQTNSVGNHNILELTRRCDADILFTSTSEVYGDAQKIPTPESYWGNVNPIGPRSCYDEGKRFAEALFMAYQRECELNVKIARIFNTYGPRIRADGFYARALPRFIIQALSGKPITVYGDGTQTRSFCYVGDTVLGLLLFSADMRAKGKVLNIGNPSEITILELARKIKKMTGSASPITFHPLPEDDPKRRCPDISRVENLIGWKPEISIEQGLERTVESFESLVQIEEPLLLQREQGRL